MQPFKKQSTVKPVVITRVLRPGLRQFIYFAVLLFTAFAVALAYTTYALQ